MFNYTRPYWNIIALTLVALTYLFTAYTLPKSVFWSPDEGAKFLHLQTLLGWQGGLTYQPPYPGRTLDPNYQFYPQHPIYPKPLANGQVLFHWPIWFPLLTIVPYKLFGLSGLYLIPLLSGWLIAWLTGKITTLFDETASPLAILAVGLTTPMFFYSLLFWEHTLVVLLGLAAMWYALQLQQPKLPIALMGLALFLLLTITLRPEMFFYAFALIMAVASSLTSKPYRFLNSIWFRLSKITLFSIILMSLLTLGQLPQLLAWSIQHGFIGARYSETVDVFLRLARSQDFWFNFPLHLRNIWVNNEANAGPVIPTFLSWLGLASLFLTTSAMFAPAPTRLALWSSSSLFMAALSGYILFLPDRYRLIHAFFLPAPYLLLAMCIWTNCPTSFHFRLLTRTTFSYLFLGTLATILRQGETLINPEWGARYLLMLYPLLVICASIGVVRFYRSLTVSWQKHLLIGLTLLLLALGFGYEQRGLQEIRQTKRDWLALARAVTKIKQPILTDFEWLPSILAVQYVNREMYIMVERDNLNQWLTLAKPHTDSFVFMSFFLLETDLVDHAQPPIIVQNSYIAGHMNFTEFKFK